MLSGATRTNDVDLHLSRQYFCYGADVRAPLLYPTLAPYTTLHILVLG